MSNITSTLVSDILNLKVYEITSTPVDDLASKKRVEILGEPVILGIKEHIVKSIDIYNHEDMNKSCVVIKTTGGEFAISALEKASQQDHFIDEKLANTVLLKRVRIESERMRRQINKYEEAIAMNENLDAILSANTKISTDLAGEIASEQEKELKQDKVK